MFYKIKLLKRLSIITLFIFTFMFSGLIGTNLAMAEIDPEVPNIQFVVNDVVVNDAILSLTVTVTNSGADYENARYGMMVRVDGLQEDTIPVSYGDGLSFNLTRVPNLFLVNYQTYS